MNNLYIKKYYNKGNEIKDIDFIKYYIHYLPKNFTLDNFTLVGHINNLYNMFCTIHIESNYENCYLCKRNINYKRDIYFYNIFKKNYNKINDDLLIKIEKKINNNNRLFIYELEINKTTKIYLKFYYHLCKCCYEESLYYFYKKFNHYPKNSVDGNLIIKSNVEIIPSKISEDDLKEIKNKEFPDIYECDKYANKMYKF